MKITADYLRQLINEVTQGEVEFAELEAARQNFIENRGSGEALDDLLFMTEKLVEPLMMEMGLYFEVQEFLNHGELVFTNDRNMEVRIDPRGAMGRYDVLVNPLHDAHDSFDPVEISLDSMKGVVQYIKDEFEEELQRGGTYKQPPRGMVGEPEGQMELPLPRESKMRITKSQLQQIIREEAKNLREAGRLDIELYLKDAADGMASHGMGSKTIEMGLVELFMDKIDGPQAPIADYEPLIKDIAMEAGGGVRMENKMRITKSQLQQVIREAIKEEAGDRISGAEMLAMYDAEQGLDQMSAQEAMDEVHDIIADIVDTSNDDRSSQQASRAIDLLRVIRRG